MLADLLNAATAFVDWLATLDGWAVLLVTFLSTAVEMTFLLGLLVPGESVVMLSGSLPDGPAGLALAVVVGTAGALTGQIIGYAVGRVFGTRLRATRLGRRIGAERFDRAEAYLAEHGASALVAVRFVAVIHSVVPIVAGAARMPFGRFLGWSALGTVLWVGAFAGAGAATAEADTTGGLGVVLTAIGATCLGVVPLGARMIRRMLPGGRTAVDAVPAGPRSTRAARPGAVPVAAVREPVAAAGERFAAAGRHPGPDGRRVQDRRSPGGRPGPGRGRREVRPVPSVRRRGRRNALGGRRPYPSHGVDVQAQPSAATAAPPYRDDRHQLCIVPSANRFTGNEAGRYGYRAASSSSMSTPRPGSSDG